MNHCLAPGAFSLLLIEQVIRYRLERQRGHIANAGASRVEQTGAERIGFAPGRYTGTERTEQNAAVRLVIGGWNEHLSPRVRVGTRGHSI